MAMILSDDRASLGHAARRVKRGSRTRNVARLPSAFDFVAARGAIGGAVEFIDDDEARRGGAVDGGDEIGQPCALMPGETHTRENRRIAREEVRPAFARPAEEPGL